VFATSRGAESCAFTLSELNPSLSLSRASTRADRPATAEQATSAFAHRAATSAAIPDGFYWCGAVTISALSQLATGTAAGQRRPPDPRRRRAQIGAKRPRWGPCRLVAVGVGEVRRPARRRRRRQRPLGAFGRRRVVSRTGRCLGSSPATSPTRRSVWSWCPADGRLLSESAHCGSGPRPWVCGGRGARRLDPQALGLRRVMCRGRSHACGASYLQPLRPWRLLGFRR